MLASVWTYRGFVVESIRRDLRTRYAGSVLGAAWQLLSPLALIAIYTMVFSQVMRARLPGLDDQYAYAIFVCAGLLPWNMFAEILTRSQGMFVEHANLLKKANFPRICLPAIVVGGAVANFLIVYGVFLALLMLAGRSAGFATLYAIVPIFLLVLIAAGIGVLLGLAHVFFRDVGQAIGIVLQLVFWLTPIVYPITVLPAAFGTWIAHNPLTPIFRSLQEIFLGGALPSTPTLAPALAAGLGVCAVAWWAFRAQAPLVVDEL